MPGLDHDLRRLRVEEADDHHLVLVEERPVRAGERAGSAAVERLEPAAPDDAATDVPGAGDADDVPDPRGDDAGPRARLGGDHIRGSAACCERDGRNAEQVLHWTLRPP